MSRWYLLFMILFFASCTNCTRYTRGYVVDWETRKPIIHATINSFAALNDRTRDHRTTFTDTTGWFEAACAMDYVAKCGNLKIEVVDTGYHTVYVVDMPQGDTVFLHRIIQ